MRPFSAPARFIAAFAATMAVLAGPGVAAFCVVVDPFSYFELVSVPGFNAQNQVAANARLAKAHAVCRLQPATVIMGTSRVEVGIDPQHPALQGTEGPAYNLALFGSGIHELNLTLRHAVHASPRLKRVLVGIDFLMFNANREAVVFETEAGGFDERRLLLAPGDTCGRAFFRDWRRFLGDRGVRAALKSVGGQMAEPIATDAPGRVTEWVNRYDELGWRSNFAVVGKLRAHEKALGDYPPVQESYYVGKVWRPPPEHRYCFASDGQPNTLDEFREMLDFARSSGIDLRIFINPIHARMLIAIRDAGLWPTYEAWKRGLVQQLAGEADASGKPALDLWDFSGFNAVTIEPTPKAGESALMRSFWEPSHYRSAVGDMMLDRMLGYRSADREPPADFGVELNPATIEDWTLGTRAGLQDYMRDNPGEASLVAKAVDEEMKDQGGSNCGDDLKRLREAQAAFERGEVAAAQAARREAINLHARDREIFAELDLPYRETAFDALLVRLASEFPNAQPD